MMKSLIHKTMTRFVICIVVLLVLSAPLFYVLTRNFYAEDIIEVVDAVKSGETVPSVDLEADVLQGILIQYVLIVSILGLAIILMVNLISRKMWAPFDETLSAIESFSLESGKMPRLPDSDVSEFARLNGSLEKMMSDSLRSYLIQKEFTENASHELQTPLAVFRSKLDMLLQQPEMTEQQAVIVQDMNQICGRLSRLSRNLLLLAKMDNRQFSMEDTDVTAVVEGIVPYVSSLSDSVSLKVVSNGAPVNVMANRTLLETLLNNLIVNAVRHSAAGGQIVVSVADTGVAVSNDSPAPALDASRMFDRFSHISSGRDGNGLGLAIAKAVCDYHGWAIAYSCIDHRHTFTVKF